MFSPEQIGLSYASLRNAVSKYIKCNDVDETGNSSQIIYDTEISKITIR